MTSVQSLVQNVTAITYNASADEIVAVGQGSSGGTMQGLDPITFAQRWALTLPSIGSIVSVSDDGTQAYVGLCSQNSIAQVNLTSHTLTRTFSLPQLPTSVCAEDIKVVPGNPSTIVTALQYQNVPALAMYGLVMYANGAALPNSVTGPTSAVPSLSVSTKVGFVTSTTLAGYTSFITPESIQSYAIDGNGITATGTSPVRSNATGRDFTVVGGGSALMFTGGLYQPLSTSSDAEYFSNCASSPSFYDTAVLDPSGSQILCISSVPQAQRQNSATVELQVAAYALSGERVTRRARINLATIISIPSGASPEVEILKTLALPTGQLVMHIYDFQSNRLLLIGIPQSSLPTVSAPTLSYGQTTQNSVTVNWANLPVTATAYDTNFNRVYGLVPATYGGPNGSSLVIFDGTSQQVTGYVPLPREPVALVLSSDGTSAYISEDGGIIQQVNLQTQQLGWAWRSGGCAIDSMTARTGFSQQVIADTGGLVRLIDTGSQISSAGYAAASLYPCGNGLPTGGGGVYQQDSNDVFETTSGTYYKYQISANTLIPNGSTFISTFSGGGGAFFQFANLGFFYDDAGDVANLTNLTQSTVAPAESSYLSDPTDGYSVTYAGVPNVGSSGPSSLTSFAPLSATRFLALRSATDATQIDLETGAQRTARFFLVDRNVIGQSAINPTALSAQGFAFGQANQTLGQGRMYFLGLGF